MTAYTVKTMQNNVFSGANELNRTEKNRNKTSKEIGSSARALGDAENILLVSATAW